MASSWTYSEPCGCQVTFYFEHGQREDRCYEYRLGRGCSFHQGITFEGFAARAQFVDKAKAEMKAASENKFQKVPTEASKRAGIS